MKGSRVAIRYAKALLATAQEQQAVEQVAADMEAVYTTLENSHELKAVLASPVISAELKGDTCLLYTSPSPRDLSTSRMPSSA